MNYCHDIDPLRGEPYQGVVEIPRGSNAKYEYDETQGFLRLDRGLITAMSYPFNYGFIPRTKGEDGDPLDAIFFTDIPLHPLTVVPGKIIGVLEMVDDGQRDDKVVILPKFNAHRYKDVSDIPKEYLEVYVDFFVNYKNLQKKKCEILGWKDKDIAIQTFILAQQRYYPCDSTLQTSKD